AGLHEELDEDPEPERESDEAPLDSDLQRRVVEVAGVAAQGFGRRIDRIGVLDLAWADAGHGMLANPPDPPLHPSKPPPLPRPAPPLPRRRPRAPPWPRARVRSGPRAPRCRSPRPRSARRRADPPPTTSRGPPPPAPARRRARA